MSNNDTIWESLNCLSKYFETSGALLSQPNIKNAINENTNSSITIPMQEGQRSLNLSNSVAIVLYEAIRQNG